METLGSRIRAVRVTSNLTQQEFASRLGLKQNTVANYETGRRVPINAVLSAIAREFGVSEAWLRDGEGDMFIERSKSLDDVARQRGMTPLERRLIEAYLALSPDLREAALHEFQKAFLAEGVPGISPEAVEAAGLDPQKVITLQEETPEAPVLSPVRSAAALEGVNEREDDTLVELINERRQKQRDKRSRSE